MMMLYVGVAMLAVGWLMLICFGVTSEEFEKGKPYTASDNLAGYLLVGGLICIVGGGSYALLRYGGAWFLSLFYDSGSSYAAMSVWAHCEIGALFAAVHFFFSLMAAFHAEGQFRRLRNHNHTKAAIARDTWKGYARRLCFTGQIFMAATVGFAIMKTL